MNLKLREIAWEITNQCRNNCEYCGSSHILNRAAELSRNDYCYIIDNIKNYPPDRLDVSGGDPLLVDFDIHAYLISRLSPRTKCSIIVNPLSFARDRSGIGIVNLYQRVGISINTKAELEAFNSVCHMIQKPVTIITNFSLLNHMLVDHFSQGIADRLWQIQFTMTKDQTSLYDKPNELSVLNDKLGMHSGPMVIADNANNACCCAGINSLGLLYDGSVVPCLSMRSWVDKIEDQIQGNLLISELKTIWMQRFQKQRFEDTLCCKDYCRHAKINPRPVSPLAAPIPVSPPYTVPNPLVEKHIPSPPISPYTPPQGYQITVYAVAQPFDVTGAVQLYGVSASERFLTDAITSTINPRLDSRKG